MVTSFVFSFMAFVGIFQGEAKNVCTYRGSAKTRRQSSKGRVCNESTVSSKWNWLDIRAVFSGVWIGTIGLAAFRLAAYQEEWELKTWVLLSLAYFSFHIGLLFYNHIKFFF